METKKAQKFRSCTDVLSLIIFCGFVVLLVILSSFAVVFGDSRQLIHGVDSFGNVCGNTNEKMADMSFTGLDMTDKPNLFFFDVKDLGLSLKICVDRCPDKTLQTPGDLYEYFNATGTNLCLYTHEFIRAQYIPESSQVRSFTDSGYTLFGPLGPCPKLPVYRSSAVLNRCVPHNVPGIEAVNTVYAYLNSICLFQQLTSDIYASWKEILSLTCLAAIISLILLIFLHCLVSFVGWILLGLAAVTSVAVTVYLWVTYSNIKSKLDSTPMDQLLEEEVNNEEAFLLFSIFATIGTIVLLLILFAMRKRMRLAGSLFKEASQCIRQIPFIFLQPFLTFTALMTFMMAWFYVVVCLATVMKPESMRLDDGLRSLVSFDNETNFISSTSSGATHLPVRGFTVIDYITPRAVRYFWWIQLIALIWIPQFILAAQQFVISSTVAQWYFTRQADKLRRPIWRSIGWLFFYHMGSIAFGSFIITLCKLPRLFVTWLQNRVKGFQDDSCRASCTKMCCCCFWCLENFLRYMNHNAYTVVAIEGTPFLTSARVAFQTLVANALQIAVLNSVGDFVLFLGKIFTTTMVCLVGMVLLQRREDLHLYAAPLAISCVFAYFVSHCILSLFEMVVDTMLLCYCEDTRTSENGAEHELFTPESLQRVINRDVRRESDYKIRYQDRAKSSDELTEMTIIKPDFSSSA